MPSSDIADVLASLESSLDEVIALLDQHGEEHWRSWAERCRQSVRARDASAIGQILGAYGGMGSFNDLLILGANGHAIAPKDEKAVNRRLQHLRTAIWTSARRLRREYR